ncbi:HD domain-containing protein [Vibrio methylphosphonaticus]|uniref:HD domain-containing protein n=1 Tax=Vibrio methylphosphonaticus TaxID=2946866 RepID=UPI002029CB23|nr:HD domain-containing protein [Vibrio methylphosphonaticus]MCL9775355.1 HD domain-containing protein [Vibrio methylphosphonaticus]
MTTDAAHDLNHVLRVVRTATQLALAEGANLDIVLPAAYLHDCFTYPKDHPERKQSSFIAANKACDFLSTMGYPESHVSAIHHAIVAHSYSANIEATSIEARVVQDADRLDALGAVGVTRCIQVSASLGRTLYSLNDPFCEQRSPDDSEFTIDHFYTKLFSIAKTMRTEAGRNEAMVRVEFMQSYLTQLAREIS